PGKASTSRSGRTCAAETPTATIRHFQTPPAGCPARISASLLPRNRRTSSRKHLRPRRITQTGPTFFHQTRKSERHSAFRPVFSDLEIQCEKSGLSQRSRTMRIFPVIAGLITPSLVMGGYLMIQTDVGVVPADGPVGIPSLMKDAKAQALELRRDSEQLNELTRAMAGW